MVNGPERHLETAAESIGESKEQGTLPGAVWLERLIGGAGGDPTQTFPVQDMQRRMTPEEARKYFFPRVGFRVLEGSGQGQGDLRARMEEAFTLPSIGNSTRLRDLRFAAIGHGPFQGGQKERSAEDMATVVAKIEQIMERTTGIGKLFPYLTRTDRLRAKALELVIKELNAVLEGLEADLAQSSQ